MNMVSALLFGKRKGAGHELQDCKPEGWELQAWTQTQ